MQVLSGCLVEGIFYYHLSLSVERMIFPFQFAGKGSIGKVECSSTQDIISSIPVPTAQGAGCLWLRHLPRSSPGGPRIKHLHFLHGRTQHPQPQLLPSGTRQTQRKEAQCSAHRKYQVNIHWRNEAQETHVWPKVIHHEGQCASYLSCRRATPGSLASHRTTQCVVVKWARKRDGFETYTEI